MQRQQHLPNEQDVMLAFTKEYADRLRYNHATNRWLIWQGNYWHEDQRQRVLNFVLRHCRSASGGGEKPNRVSFGRSVEAGCRTQEAFATTAEDWDADPMLLGTPGGVVDLNTGELRPGRPQDMISKAVACTPSDHDYCPRWLQFLDEALAGKEENISFFQRFCGYGLTGKVDEESLLFIVGLPGTGKGTATKTIMSIMKDYGLTVPVTMFTDAGWRALEYYRARLLGRRLILAGEPAKGAKWDDAQVNQLTGGDRITGRNPAGLPFDYDPTFKLAFHGEQVPQLKSVSTGLLRRLGILPFNVKPANPDTKLKAALRAEWPGILRWKIIGCLAWQQEGLNPPPDVRAAVEAYIENQDTLSRWIEDCCELQPYARTRPGQLLASYNEWAGRYNEEKVNAKSFAPDLRRRFGEPTTVHGYAYYRGVAIKSSIQKDE